MKTPHYLRFVQALVLAAAVPACSSGDDPAPAPKGESPTASATTTATAAPEAPKAAATSAPPAATAMETQRPAQPAPQADTGADSGLPFSSGPIVPPEMPASFA